MKRHLKGLALEQYKATLPKFNQKQKNIPSDPQIDSGRSGTALGHLGVQKNFIAKMSHFSTWFGGISG